MNLLDQINHTPDPRRVPATAKFTPENITALAPNQIFVFGSNESGVHGAGAALLARQKFGAVAGVGFGKQGQSFAIPTKDWRIRTLDLPAIKHYVSRFLEFATHKPAFEFLVTKLGCGLAGYRVSDIAPFFAWHPENVILPEEFHQHI